jgi:hypothetical protein
MGCIEAGCESESWARQMCRKHYQSWRRSGAGAPVGECSVDGCGRPIMAKTMCHAHYQRHTYEQQVWTDQRLLMRRETALRSRYGIGLDDYAAMMESQSGRCAICRTTEPGRANLPRLVVDHDHSTGMVRGLLCHPCNVALGQLNDDPARLRAAADYLESASSALEAI